MSLARGAEGRAALERAAELDADDPLAGFRERFVFADKRIYLDGNSLGRLPRATVARLAEVIEREWGRELIGSWEAGWLDLPVAVGDLIGRAVLGAAPGQVAVADSTTVNLFKLASAALAARPGRTEILTDTANFPTDRYVLESLAARHGGRVRWLAVEPDGGPEPASVAAALSERTALVCLSHVSYRTAHIAELAAITRLAHGAGALVLWDASHSAGSVPLDLDAAGVDLAAGCSYKYLNGGPGAPAWLYVAARHQGELAQPVWGWLGRADPFAMGPGYEPAPGIRSFLSGTPPILSLAAVQTGVELVAEAGLERVRAKGVALTEFLIALADERLAGTGIRVASPRDAARRGAHVALAHPDGRRLAAALIDRRVIVDFREPDLIRCGLSPLTTSFAEVAAAVEVLAELLGR